MKIGFDFDKVLIDYPPVVPYSFINLCYRNGFFSLHKKSSELKYRSPGKFEQKLRLLTHFQFMRMPIKKNVRAIQKIKRETNHKLFLVSGRFSFLEDKTEKLLTRYTLKKYFEGIYFNFGNKQPHKFKEAVLKNEKVSIFIDDDIELLEYLAKKLPKVSFFWITKEKKYTSSHITPIPDLNTFYLRYLKKNGK